MTISNIVAQGENKMLNFNIPIRYVVFETWTDTQRQRVSIYNHNKKMSTYTYGIYIFADRLEYNNNYGIILVDENFNKTIKIKITDHNSLFITFNFMYFDDKVLCVKPLNPKSLGLMYDEIESLAQNL